MILSNRSNFTVDQKGHNELMGISNSPLAESVGGYLTSDFERAVFKAALMSFDHVENPLRVNNFATALRELGRIHLEAQAPDSRVKKCDWFEQKHNELGQPVIERAQRAKYAIQGELPDDFVRDTLGIEVNEAVRDYTRLIGRLSAFTHVNEKTFGVSDEKADELADQALEVFDQLFMFVKERREATRKAAEDEAQDALRDVLYGEVNQELDRLSTHTSVVGVDLYGLKIISMDSKQVRYTGHGNVDARLQYGSDSDVDRDDGVVSSASCPLTCEFVADTCSPLEISVVPGTLNVDTISFYEPQDEEDFDMGDEEISDASGG
jgi:hypothetical protein